MSPSEMIDLLIERAPALRTAGVTELQLEGVSVKLAPPEAVVPSRDDKPLEDESFSDPLDDPATYSGGRVPGFTLRRREEFEG